MLKEAASRPSGDQQMSWSGIQEQRSELASVRRPSRMSKPELPDIDSQDKNNPLAAVEYVSDIFK